MTFSPAKSMKNQFIKKNYGHIVLLTLTIFIFVLAWQAYKKDKNISFGIAKAYAAISYDNSSSNHVVTGGGTTLSWSYDFEGNYMLIGCEIFNHGTISSVSFDTLNFANSYTEAGDPNGTDKLYYAPIDASHHGTHTITVNGDGNTMACASYSLDGVAATSEIRQEQNFATSQSGSAGGWNFSSWTSGDWIIAWGRAQAAGNISATGNTNFRDNSNLTFGMFDDSTDGTLTWNTSSSGRQTWIGVDLIPGIVIPASTISFHNPSNTGSYFNDFGTWQFNIGNISATSSYSAIVHFSRLSSTTLEMQNSGTLIPPFIVPNVYSIPKTSSLFPDGLNNPQWWAQANLLLNGNVIATSSLISWQMLNSSTSSIPVFPGAWSTGDVNSTSSIWFVDCSAYDGAAFLSTSTIPGLACALKKSAVGAAQILFQPDAGVLRAYSELSIKNKFPFAYWYNLQDIYTAESISSTSAFPSLTIYPFGSSTTGIVVFSSSTVTTLVTSERISLFRTLMKYALYFGFSWYIYHRIKHIFDK